MSNHVKASAAMDDETFVKHVNARHTPIGTLTEVRDNPATNGVLREYHARVHRLGIEEGRDVTHTHRGEFTDDQ